MFTSNPFAELSASTSPEIMQGYVIVMFILVVAGTIIDDASALRSLGRAVRSRRQDVLDPRDRVQVVESRGAMGDPCRGS